jgi:hypothetical protein
MALSASIWFQSSSWLAGLWRPRGPEGDQGEPGEPGAEEERETDGRTGACTFRSNTQLGEGLHTTAEHCTREGTVKEIAWKWCLHFC